MTWIYDAATGAYRNHALSSNIRREAIADTIFLPFARAEEGYGRRKGESVSITRVLKLPPANRVSELDQLPAGRPIIQTVSVPTAEWGFKIPMTEFEINLTHFDITNVFQQVLRDQLSLTMDIMVAEAMKLTPVKYTPLTPTTGEFVTDGTPDSVAAANLTIAHLREIHDYMHGTLKVPKFRGGKYVGILTTNPARGIKNDPEYKSWQAPTTAKPFVTGSMSDVEGFLLYETNHFDALDNTIGTNGICGECVFFGADAVALAEVLTPELRAGIPTDLGRHREVGWVGEVDAGLVWDTAALARVIHVTSL
jgi:hypothetical protein